VQTFKTSKARENILSRIRKGLGEAKLPMPFPEIEKELQAIYTPTEGLEEVFAEAFIKLGGKFVFCDSEKELIDSINILHADREWQHMLCADNKLRNKFEQVGLDIAEPAEPYQEAADACITGCEMLVARTGSVLFSAAQPLGRTAPVFYPVHIIVAYADQVVSDIDEAFATMKKKYGDNLPSMMNLNTGPSRTADIEKTLVVGVHGPAEVFCFFVNADSGSFYRK
jgi:L-lactate dehydrogenase complex protein LldG